MIEELYVTTEYGREQLDINCPSGITLNYRSNLFNDISKIEASHSYTFKLPATRRNRKVFESADDIRSTTRIARKKLPAELYHDGIPLFRDANLYLVGYSDDGFECVFTWNIVKGLQELSAHDISIRDLSKDLQDGEYEYKADEIFDYEKDIVVHIGSFTAANQADTTDIISTAHSAGVNGFNADNVNGAVEFDTATHPNRPVLSNLSRTKSGYDVKPIDTGLFYATPPPVVKVSYLLNAIERHYGITFGFKNDSFVRSLVVPLITKEQSEALIAQNYVELSKFAYGSIGGLFSGSYLYFQNVSVVNNLKDGHNAMPQLCGRGQFNITDDVKVYKYIELSPFNSGEYDWLDNDTIRIGGHLIVTTGTFYGYDSAPELVIFNDINGEMQELGRKQGYYKDRTMQVHFNFEKKDGGKWLELDGTKNSKKLYFAIRQKGSDSAADISSLSGNIKIYKAFDNYSINMWTNVFHNLPDISCFDFVKAILYAMGGFPTVDGSTIGIVKFSDVQSNLDAGNVVDWSKFLINPRDINHPSIKYSASSWGSELAKRNYYLMKNDEVSDLGVESDNKYGEDWYEHSYGKLTVDDDVLDEFTTIYTSPFYGAFIANAKNPYKDTGNTQDLYAVEEDGLLYTAREAKPMLAIFTKDVETVITNSTRPDENPVSGQNLCGLKIWQFSEDIKSDSNYATLHKLMAHPTVLEVYMKIAEPCLLNIDYAKPLYIRQYNSVFVILQIERQDDGICKVNLLKVPNE